MRLREIILVKQSSLIIIEEVCIIRSIHLFIITVVLLVFLTGLCYAAEQTEAGAYSSSDFDEYARCSSCHATLRGQWQDSMHYHAYTDVFYQKELLLAGEETDGATDEFCARCHTPIGVIGAEIPPVDGSELSEISLDGVQCDFCHVVSESAGIGNGAFVVSPGDIKWGPRDDAQSGYHECEFNELYTQSAYCGMCHNVNHPFNGIPLDDTYTSWEESDYAADGVQCQDCHMSPGITHFEAEAGRAGSGAPKRDHVYRHDMIGGNVFMYEMLEMDASAEMARERLQSAATLDVLVPETAQPGDQVSAELTITNIGAGHKLPTGLTEARQMWLEVMVEDANGQVIYSSGELDGSGNIVDADVYQTVLEDSEGQLTKKIWLAEAIVSDNRIPPKESATEVHEFTIPEDVVNPISVKARLLYRSAPQDVIDELFGEGVHQVPVVEMNAAVSGINGDVETPSQSTPGPGFVFASLFIGIAGLLHRRCDKR